MKHCCVPHWKPHSLVAMIWGPGPLCMETANSVSPCEFPLTVTLLLQFQTVSGAFQSLNSNYIKDGFCV